MAWNRPTLASLISRNQADIEASLPGTDAKLRRKNLNVISKIISACAHGLYGNLAYIAKQILPNTADAEHLIRHASLWLENPRKSANYAAGPVELIGTNGKIAEEGTTVIRSDGAEYKTLAEVVIVDGVATVNVEAVIAGQAGNTLAGSVFNLASPLDGIVSTVTVGAAGITGGSDIESFDSVRERVGFEIKEPPHGGSKADYIRWAKEVPGVTRAWVYPEEAAQGTVTIRFVRDDDIDLIPDVAEVAAVFDYIDERRPVTAKGCYVIAPIADPLNFVFTTLTPNTQAVRDAVFAELQDLIKREAVPGGTTYLSHIREAISIAAGENNYVLTSPAADINSAVGHITTLGSITWP